MKKITATLLMLLLFSFLATGCNHGRVRMADKPATATREYTKWFFVFGILPDREYEINDLCPGGQVAEVHQYTSFWNGLLAGVTLGMVVPQSLDVGCNF